MRCKRYEPISNGLCFDFFIPLEIPLGYNCSSETLSIAVRERNAMVVTAVVSRFDV